MIIDKLPPKELKYKLIYHDNSVCIKGRNFVASFDKNLIILKCRKDNLYIYGANLAISSMNVDELEISGRISSIKFE